MNERNNYKGRCPKHKRASITACLLFALFIAGAVTLARAEDNNKERAVALCDEAAALFHEGNTDKAIETVREALNADPAFCEAHEQLGYMLLSKRRPEEALSAFDDALRINPGLRTSKTGKGLALLAKGDVFEAEKILNQALVLNPYPSMTHYALGLSYERSNEYKKAIEQFKEGISKFKDGKR